MLLRGFRFLGRAAVRLICPVAGFWRLSYPACPPANPLCKRSELSSDEAARDSARLRLSKGSAVRRIRFCAGLLCGVLSFSEWAVANPPGSLTLAWDPVSDPNIAGYNLYYGVASGVYTNVVQVGNTAQVTITGLVPGVTYYLAVTTRLVTGVESAYSDEILFTIPTGAPALQPSVLDSGQVNLAASAPPGHTYDVLATQDFSLWVAIGTVTVDASGVFKFSDPDSSLYPKRFYQLHEVTYTAPGSLPVVSRITQSDAGLLLQITGQVGHTYEVLTTQDFKVWGVVGAITVGLGGGGVGMVPVNPRFSLSFYQLRETDYASAQTITPFSFLGIYPGLVQILFEGVAGPRYTLQEARDFQSWTSVIGLHLIGDGTASFSDAFVPGDLPRVYRVEVSN